MEEVSEGAVVWPAKGPVPAVGPGAGRGGTANLCVAIPPRARGTRAGLPLLYSRVRAANLYVAKRRRTFMSRDMPRCFGFFFIAIKESIQSGDASPHSKTGHDPRSAPGRPS